ncbi:MAG: hypothetical protein FJX59_02155 [Alphaproteobacteria bacterium]|nr:hypothetical protein [Alphaproteobacteria bacterium]
MGAGQHFYPISRRHLLASSLVIVTGVDSCRGSAAEPKSILFVCQYGTVRSAIARELLRRRVSERDLPWMVASRGLTPEDHATPDLTRALRADRIETNRDPLIPLDAESLLAADVVVLFNPLPAGLSRPDALDWGDTPSFNADYPAAKAAVEHRIETLIDTLMREKH